MSQDVKRWDTGVYGIQYMEQDPNGAFVEHEDYQALLAENERLRTQYQHAAESSEHFAARAERLAEALREALEIGDKFTGDPDEDAATYCDVTDKARAALDQEGGNG